jgi:hypothetical protein
MTQAKPPAPQCLFAVGQAVWPARDFQGSGLRAFSAAR